MTHPVDSALGLWLTSVICEIWFAFSWVLDQFPKWSPVDRETYIDRLSARYISLECKTSAHFFQRTVRELSVVSNKANIGGLELSILSNKANIISVYTCLFSCLVRR